ncbi:MAG: DUF6279 family lipoprotein [Gammaproteobacteria bacterium]
MILTKKFLLLLVGACLLYGCTTSFVYNRLDSLITWYVDDYVDLTSAQKKQLQYELQPALNWHRQEELHKNIVLLETIRNDVEQQVQVETVAQWTEELLQSFRRIELNLVEAALEFGNTLSDEQMQEFITSVKEKQLERKKEYLSRTDEEYIEDSYDRLEDRLSGYLGNLNEKQQLALQQAVGNLQRLDQIWLADRDSWLNRVTPLLKREPGWQAEIRTLFEERETYRTDEYRRVFAHNLNIVNQAITRVLNLRNDKQQQILMTELDEFKADLQTLMAFRENTDDFSRRKTL